MSSTVWVSWSASLLIFVFLPTPIFTNAVEEALKESITKATTCTSSSPPKEPVIAMSPARFAQAVALLRQTGYAPSCGALANSQPFHLENPKTWSFCVIGNCQNKKCSCVASYTGDRCEQYSGKCWLMYCYLNSCKSSYQNLHCKCSPSLYGTKVLSDSFWYDDGMQDHYVPPPEGWKDVHGEGAKVSADVKGLSFGNLRKNSLSAPPAGGNVKAGISGKGGTGKESGKSSSSSAEEEGTGKESGKSSSSSAEEEGTGKESGKSSSSSAEEEGAGSEEDDKDGDLEDFLKEDEDYNSSSSEVRMSPRVSILLSILYFVM